MTGTITGHWFGSGNSQRSDAQLAYEGPQYRLMVAGVQERAGHLAELTVSDPVGRISRKLYWPDRAMFETADNDGVDAMLSAAGIAASAISLHRMEQSWRWIIPSLLLTVISVFAAFKWGLPAAANAAAHSLPAPLQENIAQGALSTLDRLFFEPSELPQAQCEEIIARFRRLAPSDSEHDFRLRFRQMSEIPNAMALPNGEIIVTDALVHLVDQPEELDAVLLHEIAHVTQRHGLQQVIQASTISVIVSLALGDISGVGELVAGVPVFLMQSSYSRAHESAADELAFARMRRLGIDTAHFARIIRKLSLLEPDAQPSTINGTRRAAEYLSSHPDSERRARRALELSTSGG